MDRLRTFSLVLFGSTVFALAGGCGDDDSDGGGTDTDSDSDTDTDSDSDSDTNADAGADGGTDALEIIGDYVDDWGSEHSITAEEWTTSYPDVGDAGVETFVSHITSYDNDADFLVAQNDETLSYYPSLWARYDWTYSDSHLYYCQIEYAAADEETAASNTNADRDDLAAGCAGYSWSLLTEE